MSGVFDRAPFLVIWETTRACALACVHCRAEAIPQRDPRELTTEEGQRLIDRVAAFGDPPPLLVLTGGDPLRRPDILDLVAHGTGRGLAVSLTPSGTAAVKAETLRALRDVGLARLAVSLDGASAEAHDAFRRVRGSHHHTLRIVEHARALGLPLQINTTVARETVGELPRLAAEVERFGAVLWALFFLIPVGRAQAAQALSADAIEGVLHWAAALAEHAPFGVKTTEAPHFLRVRATRQAVARGGAVTGARAMPDILGRPDAIGRAASRAGRAVTDGNGVLFVDHVGRICPSGFLPIPAGDVRTDDLVRVYRETPLFESLRDPSKLGGRCGRCEWRDRCGGSRARSHAATGDPLAEDPGCTYDPAPIEPCRVAAGGTVPSSAVSRDQVMAALERVVDPELGLSVAELGLIYGIEIRAGTVLVRMTLTSPGCPLHDAMPDWVRRAVRAIPGVDHVEVALTFDPPWSPARVRDRVDPRRS
jgi:radical SAM protein